MTVHLSKAVMILLLFSVWTLCVWPQSSLGQLEIGPGVVRQYTAAAAVTAGRLVKLNSGQVAEVGTADVAGVMGVIVRSAAASGTVDVVLTGQANVETDGPCTAGNYLTISSSLSGRAAYTSSLPSRQIIGVSLSTNSTAGSVSALIQSGKNDFPGARIGNVVFIDGDRYPFTGVGLQAAIDSLPSSGGVVVVSTPFNLGSSTITVGTVGGADAAGAKVTTLYFAAPGQWDCSGNPCFLLGTRGELVGLGRQTRINQTNSSNQIIRIPHGAETGRIEGLRLQDGSIAIKGHGTTPNWTFRRLTLIDQRNNAIETQTFNDFARMEQIFVSGAGQGLGVVDGACWRNGVYTSDPGGLELNINNASINDFVCQQSDRGIDLDPTSGVPGGLYGIGGVTMSNLQFLTIKREAIRTRDNAGTGPLVITQVNINGTGVETGNPNTYDTFSFNAGVGGLVGLHMYGVKAGFGNPHYAINLNCGGRCSLHDIEVSSDSENFNITGDVETSNLQGSFTSGTAITAVNNVRAVGTTRWKTGGNGALVFQLESGKISTQNIELAFFDRATRMWSILKDGSNNLVLDNPGVGTMWTWVKSNNNFGLNVTSPVHRFHVDGNFRIDSGQVISTLATGTAPLSVTSTTEVANLNSQLWHGKQAIDFSGALNFGSIAAQSCAALTITATGVTANNPIAPSWPAGLEDGLVGTMLASAADTVTVRLCNITASAIDPASQTFGGRMIK